MTAGTATETRLPDRPSPAPPRKRLLSALGLTVLAASAVVGSDVYGIRERLWGTEAPPPRAPAAGREVLPTAPASPAPAERTTLRSQPWWQQVATLEGSGPTVARPFTVDRGAIQWRVRWRCETGHLTVVTPNRANPVVDAPCPGTDAGYATEHGSVSLEVRADGPWRLDVEQQIDVPLDEPPLPAMTAPGARKLADGEFYRIDQRGSGQVIIYRLPDGGHALRLENFYVTPNVDLEVAFSPLPEPRSTQQIADAGYVSIALLDVTAGSMNFSIPPSVDPSQYKSIVIWCQDLFSAYSAAVLSPVQ